MPLPQTGAPDYHALLGPQDKERIFTFPCNHTPERKIFSSSLLE